MLPNLIHSQLKLNIFPLYRIIRKKICVQPALIPEPSIRMPHHLISKVGNLYYLFLKYSHNLNAPLLRTTLMENPYYQEPFLSLNQESRTPGHDVSRSVTLDQTKPNPDDPTQAVLSKDASRTLFFNSSK